MNTHSDLPEVRQGIARFAFSMLGGLLLALQLVLSPVAFAVSEHVSDSADPPQALAQSEVSVVRLVFDYTAKTGTTGSASSVLCTGLGVLVKSWPARTPSDFNSWVLTDGGLLNTTPSPCALANLTGTSTITYILSNVNVYANTAYTGHTPANALLGNNYNAVPTNSFLCFATPCSSGAVLFAFHTAQLQPTLEAATTNTTPQFGLALTNGASITTRPPQPLPGTAVAQQFLDPTVVSLDVTASQNEVGMPIINTAAQMVSIRLQGNALFTAADYNAFIAQHAFLINAPPNSLQAAWENGIKSYYAKNYRDAVTSFEQVETLNPNLKAATLFKQQASAHLNNSQSSQTGGNPVTSSESTTFFGIPRSTFFNIGIVAGLLLLIVLFILVSVWARRRHELTRFEAEQAEVRRIDDKEVLQQQKTQQQNESIEMPKQVSLLQRANTSEQNVSTINSQSPHDILCPNCGHGVRADATYCPNCRYQLTIARGVPPTLNISPAPELSIVDKALAPSTTSSQPEQAPIKELVLDDLAIQATLKRLWDKAGRLTL